MTVHKVERLMMEYVVSVGPGLRPDMGQVSYTPVAGRQLRDELSAQFWLTWEKRPQLEGSLRRLIQALARRLVRDQLEIQGAVVDVRLEISALWVYVNELRLVLHFGQFDSPAGRCKVAFSELTPAQKRLLDSVNATIDRMAWEHLRARFDVPGAAREELQVFISYRAGHEKFAEALANRLGREGIVPWFGKWEILAGDSIPGKIEEGLRDSLAFIPIIAADYQEGRWATEELQNAIAKRIEQDYRIIPVLLEECERPELIRHLRYVDFSSQDPETFESKFAELIDGIYGLELNPFR